MTERGHSPKKWDVKKEEKEEDEPLYIKVDLK